MIKKMIIKNLDKFRKDFGKYNTSINLLSDGDLVEIIENDYYNACGSRDMPTELGQSFTLYEFYKINSFAWFEPSFEITEIEKWEDEDGYYNVATEITYF